MKRKLLLALIALTCALCLIFALAGCNPAANQSGDQQETPGGQGGEQGGNSDDEKPDTHNYIFKCSQTEHWQACTYCGEETAHTPHSVSDGVCPACGYVEKCTEWLEFTEIEENEKTVGYSVSKGTATDSHIFIPSFYNNLPVISIGNNAFTGCTSLTEITIPASVSSIGNYAFYDCINLKKISIPDSVISIGVDAFYNTAYYNADTKWKNDVLYIGNYLIAAKDTLSGSYQIAPGTKLIADSAFQFCTSLTEITIPASVTAISSLAFSGCISLESITVDKGNKVYRSEGNCLIEIDTKTVILGCKYSKIPDSVTSIGDGAFFGCESLKEITIPANVTSIGASAFWDCESLTKINIPNSVTSIGYGAFSRCTSLKEITIPDSVTSIGANAFCGCESLTKINIPASVTSIDYQAFKDCTSLKEITIGNGVTSIGWYAFNGCTNLESITVDKENKVYRSEGNCIIETETKTLIVGCKTSKIPESITSIGNEAFRDCTSLTEITIPDSVTSIGDWAFCGCTSLKEIIIGNGVTSIGEGAFCGCTSLTEITIPDSVTSIGGDAFGSSLESITVSEGNQTYSSQDGILYNKNKTEIIYIPEAIKGSVIIPDSVTSIGGGAFYGCTSLTEITIPDSVTSIDRNAFRECTSLERVIFENTAGWKVSESYDMANFEEINVSDPEQNAENLKYADYYWKRGE